MTLRKKVRSLIERLRGVPQNAGADGRVEQVRGTADRTNDEGKVVMKAHALRLEGKLDEALVALREASQTGDEKVASYAQFMIGEIERDRGNDLAALEAFRLVSKIGEWHNRVLAGVEESSLLIRGGDVAQAETILVTLHRSLASADEPFARTLLVTVTVHLWRLRKSMDRRDDAIELLKGTVEKHPELAPQLKVYFVET